MSGHCYFSSMRNLGDFSSQDCTFEYKDCSGTSKRPHSWARVTFPGQEKSDIPQKHVKYNLNFGLGQG